jgi:DNA-binding transcriptional LysR family regulator
MCTPLIDGEEGTGAERLLRNYFAAEGRAPSVSMVLGSTEAVKRAVEAELGVSLVPACAVEREVQEGRLRALTLLVYIWTRHSNHGSSVHYQDSRRKRRLRTSTAKKTMADALRKFLKKKLGQTSRAG